MGEWRQKYAVHVVAGQKKGAKVDRKRTESESVLKRGRGGRREESAIRSRYGKRHRRQ